MEIAIIVVCLIFILLGIIPASLLSNEKRKEEEKKQKKAEEIERQKRQRINQAKVGVWDFPSKRFYEECVKQKATKITDDFCVRKMVLIAKRIIEENQIPEEYGAKYTSEEAVKTYFKEGKKEKQAENKEKKERERIEHMTPKYSIFPPEIEEKRAFQDYIKDLSFNEKRKAYYNFLIKEKEKEVADMEKAKEAAMKLSGAIINSAYQQPKNDWAVMGGIASGLAGPVAGAMVASQAIAENSRIEQQNQTNKAYASNLAYSVISSTDSISQKIRTAKREIERYKESINDLSYKVVFKESDTKELFNHLSFKSSINTVEGQNYVEAKIIVSSDYQHKEAEDFIIVIDGILKVKLYCGNTFVDQFYIALPENGIRNVDVLNKPIYQYPQKYMQGEKRRYRFEFSPHKLWLTER